jgi:hypothetical protein
MQKGSHGCPFRLEHELKIHREGYPFIAGASAQAGATKKGSCS